jgi:hypothetical protein
MSKALVEIRVSDRGPSILVESTASEGSPAFVDAGAGTDVILKAEKTLTTALSSLGPVIDVILSHLKMVVQRPKTVTMELGVKFGAKGTIIIAGGEAEANCKLTLAWDISSLVSDSVVAPLADESSVDEPRIQLQSKQTDGVSNKKN